MDQPIQIRTLVIERSEVISRPDSRAGIAFWTKQTKPFAIELTQENIDRLRLQLAEVEAKLNAPGGRA
ncbi:MAG: hypothetical protein R3C27_14440 [Hyphomonadaceae bacterium]